MHWLKINFCLALFTLGGSLCAEVMPNDGPYYVWEGEHYKFVFPNEYKELVPKLIYGQEKIQSIYEKSFAWKLDEKTSLVLASNNNQIANAFATIYSNNLNFYYNGGASLYDSFAIRSWLYTLLAHEGAHLYQLNPKQGLSRYYHEYLGNSLTPHILGIVPIFVSPNMFLPTWILEGNSVLNESRLGNGGRLYSGEERALFYALVRSGLLDEARLTNDHLDFPYGHEKYTIGAQFSLFLAEKFGVDQVNSFFYNNADHYINPFILNYSFQEHFGISYSDAVRDFLVASDEKAKRQKVSFAPRVVEASFIGPMNSDEEKIFFMTGDGKNKNTLNLYNKKTRQLEQRTIDLPIGKVFELNLGEYYSISSGPVNQTQYLFSLWNENAQDVENYRGKILLDKNGEKLLWFNPLTSLDEPNLYFNDQKYDVAHSGALFDKNGHIYYFKQEGKNRVLMRDKIPVFSFLSYYGKLVEIDENGKPYFIAATEYGSSLFTYEDGKILRLLDSDTVVDARKIKEGDFLVSEIGPEGYELKFLRLSVREEKPVLYSYFFENDETQNKFDEYQNAASSISSFSPREYSLIDDLRFGGVSTVLMYNNQSLFANVSGLWADPLDWNNFILNYTKDQYRGKDIYKLTYLNKKHLLQWFLDYSREQFYIGNDNRPFEENKNHDDRPEFGAVFPFFKEGLWSASLADAVSYRSKRSSMVNYVSFSIDQERHHSLEFYPYHSWSLMFEDDRGADGLRTSAVSTDWHLTLPFSLFVHTFGIYKESNEDELSMEDRIRENHPSILTHGYSLWGRNKYLLKGGRLSFEAGQFFEAGIYYASFPISLRRVAPKFIFNHYYYNFGKYKDFQERGIAIDTDLLLVHILPIKVTFATLRREQDAAQFIMGIGTQASF